MALAERYIVDTSGKRVAVVLDVDDYQHLLAELEELREREEMLQPGHDPDTGQRVKSEVLKELAELRADYQAGRIQGNPLIDSATESG